MFNDIKGSENWIKIDFVNKGWSKDKKYHILTKDGEHLLLRIFEEDSYETKKREYEIIKKLSCLNFEMSKAYDFGKCQAGAYMLLSWIEGEDMESVLPSLSFKEQYNLGVEAGQILKKIHGVDIEFKTFDWYEFFTAKMNRKIEAYNDCELKYDNGHLFIDYINRAKDLLKNRPVTLHHGDFHVGNMIYTKSKHVGIIDFNRFDFGDPWEEFNRIVWDIQASPAFATGRLNAYFDNEIPTDFFDLLALYISSNTLSSLPWAVEFGEKQIDIMTKQAEMFLENYDDFKTVIPKWYKKTMGELSTSLNDNI